MDIHLKQNPYPTVNGQLVLPTTSFTLPLSCQSMRGLLINRVYEFLVTFHNNSLLTSALVLKIPITIISPSPAHLSSSFLSSRSLNAPSNNPGKKEAPPKKHSSSVKVSSSSSPSPQSQEQKQSFTQPVQGFEQSGQGFTQPVQGFTQPVQGFTQPVQGFTQPVQGFPQGQGFVNQQGVPVQGFPQGFPYTPVYIIAQPPAQGAPQGEGVQGDAQAAGQPFQYPVYIIQQPLAQSTGDGTQQQQQQQQQTFPYGAVMMPGQGFPQGQVFLQGFPQGQGQGQGQGQPFIIQAPPQGFVQGQGFIQGQDSQSSGESSQNQ